jgi:lipopolysaccharide/colanic/teichoic acid biosynthesis glycosyltransferase
MARFRLLLVILVVWLTLLFNIERPNWFGLGSLDLPSIVYIVAGVVCLAILLFPDLGYVPVWLLILVVLIVYVPIRMIIVDDPRHDSIYVIVSELIVLVLTVIIARLVSFAVSNFEKAVENVIVRPENSRVLAAIEGEEAINNELLRARRYERPVSLMIIRANELKVLEMDLMRKFDLETAFRQKYLQNKIAQMISILIYRSDIVTTYQDDMVLCLPETAEADAQSLAKEIYNMLKARLNLRVEIGLAVFPQDALITPLLIQKAMKQFISFEDEGDQTSGTGIDTHYPPLRPETQTHAQAKQLRITERYKRIFNAISSAIPSPEVVPNFPEQETHWQHDQWVYQFPFASATSRNIYSTFKRILDVITVVVVMPVALPLMGLIALMIKLDDHGPLMFMQERTGMGGHRFKMLKFRTMVVDAEARLGELSRQGLVKLNGNNQLAAPLKLDHDPRITRIGRFLRKTSLDELPQLLNVLRGEMSLVGPRPTSWGLDNYTLLQTERLSIRPGITGLWQIYSRGTTDFDLWLKWDVIYIDKMSFMFDIEIILHTIRSVLSSRGAR